MSASRIIGRARADVCSDVTHSSAVCNFEHRAPPRFGILGGRRSHGHSSRGRMGGACRACRCEESHGNRIVSPRKPRLPTTRRARGAGASPPGRSGGRSCSRCATCSATTAATCRSPPPDRRLQRHETIGADSAPASRPSTPDTREAPGRGGRRPHQRRGRPVSLRASVIGPSFRSTGHPLTPSCGTAAPRRRAPPRRRGRRPGRRWCARP